jgi:hypothetical protein
MEASLATIRSARTHSLSANARPACTSPHPTNARPPQRFSDKEEVPGSSPGSPILRLLTAPIGRA